MINTVLHYFPLIFYLYLIINKQYNVLTVILFIELISYILKLLTETIFGYNEITSRPNGNENCLIFSRNESISNIGMPSSHSAFAGYLFVWCLQNYKKDDFAKYILPISLIIPISRLGKDKSGLLARCDSGCHNIPQVFIGFSIGATLGYQFLSHLN